MTVSLTAVMLVSSFLLGESLPKVEVPREVVDHIESAVPKGWTVTARGDSIVVRRDRPVTYVLTLPNAPPFSTKEERKKAEPRREGTYEISLRFQPFISLQEYERLRAEN